MTNDPKSVRAEALVEERTTGALSPDELVVVHSNTVTVDDPAFEFFVPTSGPGNGRVWPLAQAGDLVETHHQTWVREPRTGYWRLDIFREPSENDTWICRRNERIRLPYHELIAHTTDRIPYARPEVVLLFKAKWSDLPKNQADFAAVLPLLEPARRLWLSASLALVHPDHPWRAALV